LSAFADSSALVKLYADEPGSDALRSLDVLVVSCLARVEVVAAFWRKHRLGELAEADAVVLSSDFEADFFGTLDEMPRFVVIDIVADILDRAATFTAVRGLRAYDAVQLASACAARDVDPRCNDFACADGFLRRAAAAEGFALVP